VTLSATLVLTLLVLVYVTHTRDQTRLTHRSLAAESAYQLALSGVTATGPAIARGTDLWYADWRGPAAHRGGARHPAREGDRWTRSVCISS
jgi:hypothetical protein